MLVLFCVIRLCRQLCCFQLVYNNDGNASEMFLPLGPAISIDAFLVHYCTPPMLFQLLYYDARSAHLLPQKTYYLDKTLKPAFPPSNRSTSTPGALRNSAVNIYAGRRTCKSRLSSSSGKWFPWSKFQSHPSGEQSAQMNSCFIHTHLRDYSTCTVNM